MGQDDEEAGPESLQALQAWFGAAISRPLPDLWSENPLEVSAPGLAGEGNARIHGRGGFSGFERLGVYNQQYWFRLVSIMQEEYPCTVHLLGLKPFNARVARYLSAHPPSSPYLARLDAEWPAFMAGDYQGGDREAVLQGLAFDRAFSRAVDAPDGRPVSEAGGDLENAAFRLAPHASALQLGFDFPAYRALCLADESLEGRFDLRPDPRWMLIWRARDCALWQKPIPSAAGKLLEALREPGALAEVFDRLEGALTEPEQAELEAGLSGWFAEWTEAGILVLA